MKASAIAHSTSWSSSKAVVVAGKRVYRAVGEGALSLSMSMSLSGYVDVDVDFLSFSLTKSPSVFELVSAYGGVGLSLGLPYVSSSIHDF